MSPRALPLLTVLMLAPPATASEPTGETLRVPVARDTWVSSVDGEADANLGGAPG